MNRLQQSAPKARRRLDSLLEWLVIVLVMSLVLVVLWGVFTRFVLNSPSRWTEEVARLQLMWVALLGAPVAYERREHLGFDYLVSKLDPAVQRLLAVIGEVVVIAFAAVAMVYGGYVLVSETLAADQVTPALGWKMGYVYSVVPISGCFIVFYSVNHLLSLLGADPRQPGEPEVVSPK